jgi:hypothetical protein
MRALRPELGGDDLPILAGAGWGGRQIFKSLGFLRI